MVKYYVYLHLKPNTDEPFYVGKGSSKWNRAFSKKNRNRYWHNIVAKYGGFDVLILESDDDESYINDLEIYWIAQMKSWGFNLCNMTYGGEGISGLIHSEETISLIKSKRAKQIITQEHKEAVSKWSTGRIPSKETLAKRSDSMKGFKHSEETKKHLSELKLGGGPRAKLVLNLETGIFYNCAKDASKSTNISYNTFKQYLNGRLKNKTPFIYV